jgi:eukaryotic-like serine/threonine-protein kinase
MDAEALPAIPGFELIAKLSSGGMGDILLAHRKSSHGFEKLFAIKTIRGDKLYRPDVRAMFLDEARLLARLDHPSIAQVYDFGEADGTLYLAMEYVAGVTFGTLIKDTSIRLSPAVACRLVADVCWGLHTAHELRGADGELLGVVHRDVSPVNLLVTYSGGVKIIDFGIALMREREAPVTAVGVLKGKPSYMAPEQRHGERPDRRTDVYAACIVLYELLTRQKLFYVDITTPLTLDEMAARVGPPSRIAGLLPKGLDEIVLKGLAIEPRDRFQDARALKVALEAVIADVKGDTIQDFAEAELKSRREAHERLLKSLLARELEPQTRLMEDESAPIRQTMSAIPLVHCGPIEDKTEEEAMDQLFALGDSADAPFDEREPTKPEPTHPNAIDGEGPAPDPTASGELSAPGAPTSTKPDRPTRAPTSKPDAKQLPVYFVRTGVDAAVDRSASDLGVRPGPGRGRSIWAMLFLLGGLGGGAYFAVHAAGERDGAPPEPIERRPEARIEKRPEARIEKTAGKPVETGVDKPRAKPVDKAVVLAAIEHAATSSSSSSGAVDAEDEQRSSSRPPPSPKRAPKRRGHRAADKPLPIAHDLEPAQPQPRKRTLDKDLVTDW